MPSRCVAARCSDTTKDGVSLRDDEHSFLCCAHFEQSCFEWGLHSQFGMAYKAMLQPDAIPTIFPLSRNAVKAPTKKRGAFLKRERLRVSGHLAILPCITQSKTTCSHHAHRVFSVQCSVFTAWKHAVISHINKTPCLILYLGKTNIKTLNLSHYACACFEFVFNDQNFDSKLIKTIIIIKICSAHISTWWVLKARKQCKNMNTNNLQWQQKLNYVPRYIYNAITNIHHLWNIVT